MVPVVSYGLNGKKEDSAAKNGNLQPEQKLEAMPNFYPGLPETPLFGTDGIRGKAGEVLTANLALELGYWAGCVLKASTGDSGPFIIGQDSRNSSDMLATAITAGLTSAGLEVWQLGLCPTPCVAHLTRHSEAIGGIMISASHNPPEDNGIKFFSREGTKISTYQAEQIEKGLRGLAGTKYIGERWGRRYYRPQLVSLYQEALINGLSSESHLRGMKIVLDLAWGASAEIAPQIFQQLGAEIICLHARPDGDRINVQCGSTHLNKLQQAVIEYQAHMGFAFDGDADRVMAVDGTGQPVDGDYILYLWGQSLMREGKLPMNLLIATVMANLGFERAWSTAGGKFIRTAVGDQQVQAKMWETGAMLGGEQSGHVICHHYGVSGDGLQTALHIAGLVRNSGSSLESLVRNSFQRYPQILQNVRVVDPDKRAQWQKCEELQQVIAEAETTMAESGRILVRASGTEPLIRVMVESASADIANYWTTKLTEAVETYLVAR
ncbi:MAG: Phosphoglucosamine mutase [Chroococcopsis gigantea SAG 12.99]|jgi:phosphoglucosamine mutase|nr:phosphoglucosamine mutase [Chlorogloea purpurea SAG 13.99]MDV2998429.1 Phosphoglucosamine mutase [Chroococcopsis gigantea SAG 12.99]